MTSIHSLHAPGADLSPRAGSSQRSGHDPQVPQAPPGWPGFREAGAEEGTQGALGSLPSEEAPGLIHRAAPLLSAPVWSHRVPQGAGVCGQSGSEPQNLALPVSLWLRAPGLSVFSGKPGPRLHSPAAVPSSGGEGEGRRRPRLEAEGGARGGAWKGDPASQ